MTDIELKRQDMYKLNAEIQASKDRIALLSVPSAGMTNEERLAQRKDEETNVLIPKQNELKTLLVELTIMVDEENKKNPIAGFPLAGERIIRVGTTFDIEWDMILVPAVNVFFIKGGTKIPITIMKEESNNKKAFVINISHFSDEYLPCKIRLESTDVSSIFDESKTFKVLKGN